MIPHFWLPVLETRGGAAGTSALTQAGPSLGSVAPGWPQPQGVVNKQLQLELGQNAVPPSQAHLKLLDAVQEKPGALSCSDSSLSKPWVSAVRGQYKI